ncbi:hypothetical protein ABPG74_015335 [Tetrahymena malaccensis]
MNNHQVKKLDLANFGKYKEGSQNWIDTSTIDSDGYREIKMHNYNKSDFSDFSNQQSIFSESQSKSSLFQTNYQRSPQKLQNSKQQDNQQFIINVYNDQQFNQYAQEKSNTAAPQTQQSTDKTIIETNENQYFNMSEFLKECQGFDNQQRVIFKGSTKLLQKKILTYQNLQLFLKEINDPYENEQARQSIFNIILRELNNLLFVILQSSVNPYPYLLDNQQDFEKNVLILLNNVNLLKMAKTADGFSKSSLFEFLLIQYKQIQQLQVQRQNVGQQAKQLSTHNIQYQQEIKIKSNGLQKIQESQENQESQLSNKILLESTKGLIRKISNDISNSPKLKSTQSGSKSPQSKQSFQLTESSPKNEKYMRQQSCSPLNKSAKVSPVKKNLADERISMMQSQQLPSKSTLKYNNYKVDKILRICLQEDQNQIARNNRDFYNLLNYSNALQVYDLDKKFFNKNHIHFAVVDDDSDLGQFIKDSLIGRPWWNIQKYNQKNSVNANFLWTQFKSQSYCQKLITKQGIQNQYYMKNNYSFNRQGDASNSQTPRQINFAIDIKQEKTYQAGLKELINLVDYQYITSFAPSKKEQIIPPFITVSDYMEETQNKSQQFYSNKYLWEINNLKEIRIHNHFQYGYYLNMNQGLNFQLRSYYESIDTEKNKIPQTFLIESKNDSESIRLNNFISNIQQEIENFAKLSFEQQHLQKMSKKEKNQVQIDLNTLFIVKITDTYQQQQISKNLMKLSEVKKMISQSFQQQQNGLTYLVQRYINNPLLLYDKQQIQSLWLQDQKFRIKYQLLLTNYNGILKAYFYNAGYGQVAIKPYKAQNDMEAHFVGYKQQQFHQGVQILEAYNEDYEIINIGNLEKLVNQQAKKINLYHTFQDQVLPQIKQILLDVVKSTYNQINPTNKQFRFQVLELDFLLDENFQVWLIDSTSDIKVTQNSNSQKIYYTQFIENVFQIAIDPIFQPLENTQVDQSKRYYKEDYYLKNKFQLIFDSQIDSFKFQQKEQPQLLTKLKAHFQENVQINKQSSLQKQYQNIIKQI